MNKLKQKIEKVKLDFKNQDNVGKAKMIKDIIDLPMYYWTMFWKYLLAIIFKSCINWDRNIPELLTGMKNPNSNPFDILVKNNILNTRGGAICAFIVANSQLLSGLLLLVLNKWFIILMIISYKYAFQTKQDLENSKIAWKKIIE